MEQQPGVKPFYLDPAWYLAVFTPLFLLLNNRFGTHLDAGQMSVIVIPVATFIAAHKAKVGAITVAQIRSAAPMLLAAAVGATAVGSSSCAHAPSPARISGASISAADLAFEAVAGAMQKLSDDKQLTADQVAKWNKFLTQFQMTFHAAKQLWEGARASDQQAVEQQAAASLTVLLSDLQYFADLVGLKVELPTGGPS